MSPDPPFVLAGSGMKLMADLVLLQQGNQPGLCLVARVIGTAPEEEKLQLAVYGGGVLGESRHLLFQVEPLQAEGARAEFTHPGEFAQIPQPQRERLAATHGEARDGPVFAIGFDPIVLLDERKHVAEQFPADRKSTRLN